MLLTNKRYTEEAIEIARQIGNEVTNRHAKWLVNPNYLLDQKEVDQFLSLQGRFCDDVIFSEQERITRNQRILLECEQARVTERQQRAETQQQVLRHVVDSVSSTAQKMMVEKMRTMPVAKLLGELPDFDKFSRFAYTPSLSFIRLNNLLEGSHRLSSSILDLVSDPEFLKRLGKPNKNIPDARMAVGQIGIEKSRLLFPLLMARPLLKWQDRPTKHVAAKVWQHCVVTSNVARMRLQAVNAKEPDVGILLGVLRIIGHFAVINHYSSTFEDALVQTMIRYRQQNRQAEYYACADVKVSLASMPIIISKLEGEITRRLLNGLEWDAQTHYIKNAVLEDIEGVDIHQRSHFGAALAQAKAYSIFDGLNSSNVFIEKHKPYWFAQVQMSGSILKQTKMHMPGLITLSL